ncbi:LacI family DNA-binding transcriptional regulator [Kutzneria buriramensis]|uniref:DNA-binding LacI/PurR family transcriptional regulator n=1 Tax=Kutzneria buriramensis TaxID=1045776 RepID=A0A3E0HE93_9PSEU|nr:LacI family DNA-binding transcriptional regulator [Kutzneria buriramensis]REH43517.1 DNA-binding LacI/PurR family transcriptional regulator [Kutzneria buriramensis]
MVTIIDVARAAGVAPSTVSYVLNGKRPISVETRRQVEQCIRDLGYRPSNRRTPSPRHRTNVLGLLAPLRVDVNMPALTRFVGATMAAARVRDHDLLVLTHDTGVAGLRRAMSIAVTDALIVLDVHDADPRVPALLTLDRPAVLVGAAGRPTGLPGVDLDFARAAERTVAHLAGLGHRSVGLVGSPLSSYVREVDHARRFTRAFETVAGRRGLRTRWRACGESVEAIRSCLDALFAEDPTITALVVENETVLPDVLEQVRWRGRRVPEDISVVAVGHDDIADRPPLRVTSVALPTAELGRLAVDTALRQLDTAPPPETRLLAPDLTVRESTAPAPMTSSCAGC